MDNIKKQRINHLDKILKRTIKELLNYFSSGMNTGTKAVNGKREKKSIKEIIAHFESQGIKVVGFKKSSKTIKLYFDNLGDTEKKINCAQEIGLEILAHKWKLEKNAISYYAIFCQH